MPARKIPLVTKEIYHVFNRTQNKEPVFVNKSDCMRFIDTLNYYQYENPPVKLSYFLSFGRDKRENIIKELSKTEKLINIITYCLMPNHFHLLVRQEKDGGISRFLSLFQNSFTKYRNTKHKRDGHVFRGQFKAVRIEDDEQFMHVHRYIHLNPYASFVVKSFEKLESYPFSSLPEFLGLKVGFCTKDLILSNFKEVKSYKKFIQNQADYQRKLGEIRHLVLE